MQVLIVHKEASVKGNPRVFFIGLAVLVTLSLLFAACSDDLESPPPTPTPTLPPIPSLPPLPAEMPAESQVTAFAPLPSEPASAVTVALGKYLFFDMSLSGDRDSSCATCHMPDSAFADGRVLSLGYPGNLHFRNTPTLLNAAFQPLYYWDGRIGNDLPTVVRDHVSEAHVMNVDGRLIIERMKQKPQMVALFDQAFGGEPTYGKVLNAVAAYVRTLVSSASPYDNYLGGDAAALSAEAQAGLEVFEGKGGCTACHNGPRLADGDFHSLGVATNPEIFEDPFRHIVFRRFFRMHGMPNYKNLREDPGLYAMTQQDDDWGKFRTPSLREVDRTAPYMHNGMLATLEDVVEFYNQGGGEGRNKESGLSPLNLSDAEKAGLAAFLVSLSSDPVPVDVPAEVISQITRLGDN